MKTTNSSKVPFAATPPGKPPRRLLTTLALALALASSTAWGQYSPPTSGLVGWWRGEGNGNDQTGNHNGTVLNGMTFATGLFGQAFTNAANGKVLVPDSQDLMLTNSLSIAAWVNPAGNRGIVLIRAATPPFSFAYSLGLDDAGHFAFYLGKYPAVESLYAPAANNQWTHVAATLDASTGDMRIYTNGMLAAQKFTSVRPLGYLDPALQPQLDIGGTPSQGFPFIGLIDEVVLYSRALSPPEVASLALGASASLTVNSRDLGGANAPDFVTYTCVASGRYNIQVSGTWQYWAPTYPSYWADAGWATFDNWATVRPKLDGTPPNDAPDGVLMLWCSDGVTTNHEWGAYSPVHEYTISKDLIAGQHLTFWLSDWYPYTSHSEYLDDVGSLNVNISRRPEPSILEQPSSQLGFWGKGITFQVSAAGLGSLSYQWRKDGTLVPGGTDAFLSLSNLQMADAGSYSVVITNMFGCITSTPAILIMNPAGVSIAPYAGVTIEGVVGLTYGIQYTTDLTDTNSWRGIANLTLEVPSQLWFDVQPAVQTKRFYRVVPGPIPIP